MALFMVANNLSPDDVLKSDRDLAFPESVVEFFEGRLGQPAGGFPEALQKKILRGRKPITGRPGASLPPADFEAAGTQLEVKMERAPSTRDKVTHLLYPRVLSDFLAHEQRYSDVSVLPTAVFFYGLDPGEELSVDIEPGKTLIIKFLTVGDPHPDGSRLVFFELNGQPREVLVQDKALTGLAGKGRPKADPSDALQVAAPMRGRVV